jgi:hypothetical protein
MKPDPHLPNRYSIITGFYGRQANRFMEYQQQRTIADSNARRPGIPI